MQERRKLLSYIEQEDIPSSAVKVTKSNYTTVTGNVLYIPLNEAVYTSRTTDSSYSPQIYVTAASGSSLLYLRKVDLLEFLGNNRDINSTIKIPFMVGSGSYYTYTSGRISSRYSSSSEDIMYGPCIDYEGGSIYYSRLPLPEDTIYFSKIKVNTIMKIAGVNDPTESSSNLKIQRFFDAIKNLYIDTE